MQNSWLLFLAAVWLLTPVWTIQAGPPSEDEPERERLERQVRYLSAALAAAQSDVDAARAREEGKALGGASEDAMTALMTDGARVREVSRELGLVAVNAGSRQGVRAGLVLMVMRGDRPLARVRVVDVRRRLAGAVIEERIAGAPYPEPGDRLVVVTDGE